MHLFSFTAILGYARCIYLFGLQLSLGYKHTFVLTCVKRFKQGLKKRILFNKIRQFDIHIFDNIFFFKY